MVQSLKKIAAEILPSGSRVALYGSRARGDARNDSDWDLHIIIPGEEQIPWDLWEKYAWPFESLGLSLNETVNARLYSITGWLKRSFLPFYKNVEREKVVILQK